MILPDKMTNFDTSDMNHFKKLFSETAVYGLGSIVPRVFNFFLVPLHTRVFSPEGYGTITNVYAWMAILNVIFLFGMETAYLRFSSKSDQDELVVFRTGQTIIFSICLFAGVFFLIYSFADGLFIKQDEFRIFLYAGLTIMVDAVCALPFARLRQFGKSRVFSLYKIINVGLLILLNVWLLVFQSATPEKVFLANLIANACYLIFFYRDLIEFRPVGKNALIIPMFQYAYPVMLTGLAGMTNEMFSRISIERWLPENFYEGKSGAYVQGIFGACYKFAILMSLVVQAFRLAAEPFFFKHSENKNSPALFASVNHAFSSVATLFMLLIGFNLGIFKYFISEAYWSGLEIVPLLLLGYLFLGVYYNMTVWFKITDRTIYGTWITGFGALITVASNYLLIPYFGITGSAFVTFLCYFSMTLLCYVSGQRYYPIPYTLKRDFFTIFGGYAILQIFISFGQFSGSFGILTGILASILALISFWFLEKNMIRKNFLSA